MDIGIWLLSDRAVELLRKRSVDAQGQRVNYDLYGQMGCALGLHPSQADEELAQLSVAILPPPGGEFYHFGTTPELIASTTALQNVVKDQRLILQRETNATIYPSLKRSSGIPLRQIARKHLGGELRIFPLLGN